MNSLEKQIEQTAVRLVAGRPANESTMTMLLNMDQRPEDFRMMAKQTHYARHLLVLAMADPGRSWLATPGLAMDRVMYLALNDGTIAKYAWGEQDGRCRMDTLLHLCPAAKQGFETLHERQQKRIRALQEWQDEWLPTLTWAGSPLECWLGQILTGGEVNDFPLENDILFPDVRLPEDALIRQKLARGVRNDVDGTPGSFSSPMEQGAKHPIDRLDQLAARLRFTASTLLPMPRRGSWEVGRLLSYHPSRAGAAMGPIEHNEDPMFWTGNVGVLLPQIRQAIEEDPRSSRGLVQMTWDHILVLAQDSTNRTWRNQDGEHLFSLWLKNMPKRMKRGGMKELQRRIETLMDIAPEWLTDNLPKQKINGLLAACTTLDLGDEFATRMIRQHLMTQAHPGSSRPHNRKL